MTAPVKRKYAPRGKRLTAARDLEVYNAVVSQRDHFKTQYIADQLGLTVSTLWRAYHRAEARIEEARLAALNPPPKPEPEQRKLEIAGEPARNPGVILLAEIRDLIADNNNLLSQCLKIWSA